MSDNAADGHVNDDVNVYRPRLCQLRHWADFDGYGFDVHVDDDNGVKYIGKIDSGSPAEAAGKSCILSPPFISN